MGLHQATDLLDDPGRPPGWTFIDPVILQGWGRGSAVVPGALAAAVPELAGVRSFLDVGSGIGLLAVAAAGVWPQATVVGIDVWGPSLEAAAANVRVAGLDDRIVLRDQDVAALDDSDAYDCAWFPTFFVTEPVLEAAMPRLYRALRPGGWLVLGRMAPPPDPLAQAVSTLRTIRGGGGDFDANRLVAAFEAVGCTAVRVVPARARYRWSTSSVSDLATYSSAGTSRSSHTRSLSSMPSMSRPGGYPVAGVKASRSMDRMRKPCRW